MFRYGTLYLDAIFFTTKDDSLKKDLLLFDKLLIDQSNWNWIEWYVKLKGSSYFEIYKSKRKEIDQLAELDLAEVHCENKNIKEDLLAKYPFEERKGGYYKSNVQNQSPLLQTLQFFILDPMTETEIELRRKGQYYSRLLAIEKQISDQTSEFTPIIKDNSLDPVSLQESYPKSLIYNILLNQLPSISETVSIEELLEFKTDEDVRRKFLALRNFVTELSGKNLTFVEVEDKIEFLLKEYESQLKLHTKKLVLSNLEIILTVGFEVLENLIRLKPSNAIKAIFSISKNKIALMEAERSILGKELAYISASKKEFK